MKAFSKRLPRQKPNFCEAEGGDVRLTLRRQTFTGRYHSSAGPFRASFGGTTVLNLIISRERAVSQTIKRRPHERCSAPSCHTGELFGVSPIVTAGSGT